MQMNGMRQVMAALSMAGNMGFSMAVNAFIGMLLGKAIDTWLDSSPWGVGVGVAFGLIAGLRSICRRIIELDKVREGEASAPQQNVDTRKEK
jgi:ATP synthase protein I